MTLSTIILIFVFLMLFLLLAGMPLFVSFVVGVLRVYRRQVLVALDACLVHLGRRLQPVLIEVVDLAGA